MLVGLWYGIFQGDRFGATGTEIMARATLISAVAGILAGGAVAWWLAQRHIRRNAEGISLAALGCVRPAGSAQVTAAIAGALIGLVFVAATSVVPMPESAKPGWLRLITGGGWAYYLWIVLALFVAPPIEEFVFRGMLWTGLARKWSPVASGIVVTFAFVVVHLTQAGGYWPAIVAIATMGAAALVARVKSGSLIPAISLHLTYNAMVVLSMSPGR